jgi:peroxiredoxin
MTAVLAFSDDTKKDWRISLNQGVVLVQFSPGAMVTSEVLVDLHDCLVADPEKYRKSNAVLDLRNIVPSGDTGYEQMQKIVHRFQVMRQAWWKHEKTALVVSSDLAFGLSRIYASLAENIENYEVRIFKDDLEGAMAWARQSQETPS